MKETYDYVSCYFPIIFLLYLEDSYKYGYSLRLFFSWSIEKVRYLYF